MEKELNKLNEYIANNINNIFFKTNKAPKFNDLDSAYKFITREMNIDTDMMEYLITRPNFKYYHSLVSYQKVTESILDKIKDKLTPMDITQCTLSETWIRNNQDHIFFWDLGKSNRNIEFSMEFLNEFKDKLDLQAMCHHQGFTEDFIVENIERLDLEFVAVNSELSEEFILKYIPFQSSNRGIWKQILRHQKLSETFLRNAIETYIKPFAQSGAWLAKDRAKELYSYMWLNRNVNWSEEFIEDYEDTIEWLSLVESPFMREKILNKYWGAIKKITFGKLHMFTNQLLSIEFLEKHVRDWDEHDWEVISRTQPLTIEFIEKYEQHIHFNSLSVNTKIGAEIKEKYIDRKYHVKKGFSRWI